MSLFADDTDQQGWRYGAMVTTLNLPALEIWRSYRWRADYENRIKELKADLSLGSSTSMIITRLKRYWALPC